MARYYSKHDMYKTNVKLESEDLLNTEKYRNDLKDALNKDFHRVNVDSAKKRAVVQHMDYDGFHQMVLGADIKGLRPEAISNVSINKSDKILNGVKIREQLLNQKDVLANNFTNKTCDDNNNNTNKLLESVKNLNINENTNNNIDYINYFTLYKISNNKIFTLFDIEKQITFNNFFTKSITSLEPNLMNEILKLVIEYLSNNDKTSSKINSDNIHNLNSISNLFSTIYNLKEFKRLKMFVSKNTKGELGNIKDEVIKINEANINNKEDSEIYNKLIESIASFIK